MYTKERDIKKALSIAEGWMLDGYVVQIKVLWGTGEYEIKTV